MTTSKNKNLTHKQELEYMNKFWDDNLLTIHTELGKLVKRILIPFKELPQNEVNDIKKCVAIDLVNQLKPLVALAATFRVAGPAKSLIYINTKGVAIDLIQLNDLTGSEALDQILDNLKEQ